MSEELVIRHCSPTLAGIKTGSLFSCYFESRDEMICGLRRLNKLLVPKGLRVLPLKYSGKRALIYIFRPDWLEDDLAVEEARRILRDAGYQNEKPDRCITELAHRLNSGECFPHEIGLFLGYPPEDVDGFIRNKGGNCKLVGCWKVYGDEAAARDRFKSYKECTDELYEKWTSGFPFGELAEERAPYAACGRAGILRA